MRRFFNYPNVLCTILFVLASNSFMCMRRYPISILAVVIFILLFSTLAGLFTLDTRNPRLKICYHGGILLIVYMVSIPFSLLYHAALFFYLRPNYVLFCHSISLWFVMESMIFLPGILCVYCTSVQLGISLRAKGMFLSLVPLWNFFILARIIAVTMKEVDFEVQKEHINRARRDEQLCATKYPIMFVHGVFYRDSHLFNYWGRIPGELARNGATIYYGEHQSAASVEDSARELAVRIRRLVEDTGCEKVNIIAHSKGGLDGYWAISEFGADKYVASLTTVSTPHIGCMFMDVLIKYIPEVMQTAIADIYNQTLCHLGDRNPDFLAAMLDLTTQSSIERNKLLHIPSGVYCQSVGSIQKKAQNGKFPFNFSYHVVKYFDGRNDGVVGEESFVFGEHCEIVTVDSDRGVSHNDMIDMNRENIDAFDVREFYVNLVHDLKNRGL